ncbi:unnamed protein product [Meganyctiphanes norvegica]|uniref:ADP-ribosylation factor-like protein 11 n=1 Tax=Meganyctiphanes norvegica TaxID=48144 RepID=A0AAV2PJC7_MEGNR
MGVNLGKGGGSVGGSGHGCGGGSSSSSSGSGGSSILDALHLTQGTLHIVMLGLDSAGKSTALYRLKFDQYLNTVPTIGFNCEKVKGSLGRAKGTSFLIWDVGGQEKIRPLWRSYTRCTDGIVFVVDSVDMERLEEAKCELHKTARLPENQQVPILVLANKQDLPGARDPQEIETVLGIAELGTTHLWYIQPACAITGEGLDEALENLYELIHKQRRLSKTNKKRTR